MKKFKLTQAEIDKLVTVDRIDVKPTVYGVGSNDVDFQITIEGKIIWQYKLWTGVLERCFDNKFKQCHPTYENITCCDEWLSFSNFLEWVNKEVDHIGRPYKMELDKDIISKGNQIYSPDVCSLVPTAVNLLLTDSAAARGDYPIGVCFDKRVGKYIARLRCFGEMKYLGYYTTPEEAFVAYKIAKEAQIKAVANQYKGVLKPAVYESLMSWEITPA